MISRQVKVQLALFGLITIAVIWYGSVTLLDLGKVVNKPYTLKAQFESPGGIYPRADVDLLGTKVGRVTEVEPGPGTGTTVSMEIDHDVEIPVDVHAVLGSKSAIGEGFINLEPGSDGGPMMAEGDVIPIANTTSPPDLSNLLGNLDSLGRSVPLGDLKTVLDEASIAVEGLGPSLGRIIDNSLVITDDQLANIDATTALIRDARTVLDTQLAVAPETRVFLRELAQLTGQLRALDEDFEAVYANGIQASSQVTDLLRDNQRALPVLLTNLLSVTEVAAQRIPHLRKTLVVFPWVLQNSATSARFCDVYDIETGKPDPQTCHYDDDGKPIYTLHLAQQLPATPGGEGHDPCTKGYEGTKRYLPNGEPEDGKGPKQKEDAEPNLRAQCTAKPSDPDTPLVRGAQNVTTPAFKRKGAKVAVYNPRSGMLATPDGRTYRLSGMTGEEPPAEDGLGWLLVQAVQ